MANPDHFSTRQDGAFVAKRLNLQLPHGWTGATAPQPNRRNYPAAGPAQPPHSWTGATDPQLDELKLFQSAPVPN